MASASRPRFGRSFEISYSLGQGKTQTGCRKVGQSAAENAVKSTTQ